MSQIFFVIALCLFITAVPVLMVGMNTIGAVLVGLELLFGILYVATD